MTQPRDPIHRPGDIVTGVVVEHRHFGVFLDIGDEEPALAVITMIEDDPRATPMLPPVSTSVEGVLLGYAGPGHQPRLSLRPSDIHQARARR